MIAVAISAVVAVTNRRSLKRTGILAAALTVAFVLVSRLPELKPVEIETAPDPSAVAEAQTFSYAIAPVGEPPAGLFYWVMGGLLLAAGLLCTWLLWRSMRRGQGGDRLAQAAGAAVRAIADGQQIEDVVMRSYLDMVSVVEKAQGIERENAVTPREFESYLAERGIPRLPVQQLTRLFEKVRYGNQRLNRQDEQAAVECLYQIQAACVRKQGAG